MAESNHQRIIWIDAVRVYAILCIIVTHALGQTLPVGEAVALMMIIGSASLFFLASGALVLPLKQPAGKWIIHRYVSIGIPMIVWGVFYAFIYDCFDPGVYSDVPVLTRLLSICVAQKGAMWFLNVLLGLYLLVPLISPWLKKASRRQVEILLLLWLLTGFYNYLNLFFGIGLQQQPHMSIVGGLYGFFGYFIMGYYIMHWPLKSQSAKQRTIVITTLLAFSSVGLVLYAPAMRNNVGFSLLNDLAVNNMAWFSLTFALFSLLPSLPKKAGRVISFFARGVFGAFLSMDFVIRCLVKPNISDPLWAVLAAVGICFATGLLLRHIPVIGKYLC